MPKPTVHVPVLLKETIDALDLHDGDVVLDATLGGGGHAEAMLGEADIHLIGLDADAQAVERVTERLASYGKRAVLAQSNFRAVGSVLSKLEVTHIDKALFDLGLSSDELELSGRGFSLQKDEPLSMTFDSRQELTATDLLAHLDAQQLTDIFRAYGEERYAMRIARAIVAHREHEAITTTTQLRELIKASVPALYAKGRIHPATKVFQALRMAVNDELDALKDGLNAVWEHLSPNGRIAVISFHSLEDRVVKHFMRDKVHLGEGETLTKKPVTPSAEEIQKNPRSRSAKLRTLQKTT